MGNLLIGYRKNISKIYKEQLYFTTKNKNLKI